MVIQKAKNAKCYIWQREIFALSFVFPWSTLQFDKTNLSILVTDLNMTFKAGNLSTLSYMDWSLWVLYTRTLIFCRQPQMVFTAIRYLPASLETAPTQSLCPHSGQWRNRTPGYCSHQRGTLWCDVDCWEAAGNMMLGLFMPYKWHASFSQLNGQDQPFSPLLCSSSGKGQGTVLYIHELGGWLFRWGLIAEEGQSLCRTICLAVCSSRDIDFFFPVNST